MKKPKSVDEFITLYPQWTKELNYLRAIALEAEMEENIKWNMPVYGYGKKNVATLFHAKAYLGVWFSQGALLSDPERLLVNASPEKTVSQRQLRFATQDEVDLDLLRSFLVEAIRNQKDGLEMGAIPAAAAVPPPELKQAFSEDPQLEAAYLAFTPYKQREFCDSISEAKRADTKVRRLQKAIEHIREGRGLSDKYR